MMDTVRTARTDTAWALRTFLGERATRSAIFVGMILSVLVISAICFIKTLSWVDKHFAGFLMNQRMLVSNGAQYHWTGIEAGLKYPDKILTANNRLISSLTDLEDIIKGTRVGEEVRYSVERAGEIIDVTVPTMRFTWPDFFVVFGISLVSGVIYLLLGVIVFMIKPDTNVSWAFLVTCLSLSILTITGLDDTSLNLAKLNLFFNAFVPGAFIHLSLLFPTARAPVQSHPYLQLIPYVISAVLGLTMVMSYPQSSWFTPAYTVTFLFIVLATMILLASTLEAYFKATAVSRQRAKVVLFGSAVSFPLPAVGMFLSYLGVTVAGWRIHNNFLPIFIVIFPASIAYAIARHNLFDVDVYIKRAVGYGMMTAIVGIGYLSIQTLMRTVIASPIFGQYGEQVYPILFALLIVFFFNPINRRVQGAIDKIFFRKVSDYKETVSAVSNALTSMLNLDEILRQVIGTVRKEMFVDTAGVVVVEREKKTSLTYFVGDDPDSGKESTRDLRIGYDDPLVALISEERKLITEYDIEEDPRYSNVKEPCGESFSKMAASVAIPLINQGEVTGFLALGNKKSGHFYTREDVDLLSTMADQAAVAIQNAKLFEEHIIKTRMEEELKIAHDIQASMLPEKAPEIEGFKIAAREMTWLLSSEMSRAKGCQPLS